MHMWLVSCSRIPRSRLKNGVKAISKRSRLKNEVYMHMWLVSWGSIPRLILAI